MTFIMYLKLYNAFYFYIYRNKINKNISFFYIIFVPQLLNINAMKKINR